MMISVYVNEEGVSAASGEKGSIRVYQRMDHKWNVALEMEFNTAHVKSIAEARRTILEMVQKLEGCKVFVAREVVGQLYYVLEANGFECFEAEGYPEEFLDSIWEAFKEEQNEKHEVQEIPVSHIEKKEKEGCYFLNLKKALNLDCNLSSKKLLLPFLRGKDFIELEMICDHLPRWFEQELKVLELKSEVVKLKENEYKVVVMV